MSKVYSILAKRHIEAPDRPAKKEESPDRAKMAIQVLDALAGALDSRSLLAELQQRAESAEQDGMRLREELEAARTAAPAPMPAGPAASAPVAATLRLENDSLGRLLHINMPEHNFRWTVQRDQLGKAVSLTLRHNGRDG